MIRIELGNRNAYNKVGHRLLCSMDWFELNLNLIPKVGATGGDANLQPTFGTLTGVVTPGTTASINLTANTTTVAVGQAVTLDVEIRTGTFTINEYRIVVEFDPTKFQVNDADPATPGTQITFLDTVFQVAAGDNNASTTGKVTLIAKTPSGNALQVNRKVAQISFQAQSAGSTNVRLATGATGSQLINQNGVAIATTVNNVNLGIDTQPQPSSTSSAPVVTTTTPAATTTASSSSSSPVTTIPDTGISDDFAVFIPITLGLFLIVVGASLRRYRQKYAD